MNFRSVSAPFYGVAAWRRGDSRREDVEAAAGQQCVDDREGADVSSA